MDAQIAPAMAAKDIAALIFCKGSGDDPECA